MTRLLFVLIVLWSVPALAQDQPLPSAEELSKDVKTLKEEIKTLSELVAQSVAKQTQQAQDITKLGQSLQAQARQRGDIRKRGREYCKALDNLKFAGYLSGAPQPFICK